MISGIPQKYKVSNRQTDTVTYGVQASKKYEIGNRENEFTHIFAYRFGKPISLGIKQQSITQKRKIL